MARPAEGAAQRADVSQMVPEASACETTSERSAASAFRLSEQELLNKYLKTERTSMSQFCSNLLQAKKVKKAVLSTTARARSKAQAKAAEKEKTSTGAPYMDARLSRFPCRAEHSSALRHSCALVICQTLVPLRRPTNACLVPVAEGAAV